MSWVIFSVKVPAAFRSVTPSLAIGMPKVERHNPREFPMNCRYWEPAFPGERKTFSTFHGNQCHNSFRWEGKTFPSLWQPPLPEVRPRADIPHRKPFPRPVPRFGTRIAKAGGEPRTPHGRQCNHPKREATDEAVCPFETVCPR